jgi:hypothetical protein
MKVIVSLKDVVNEMDILSDEHTGFLNRLTGELITLSLDELSAAEDGDDLNDYPEDERDAILKAKEVIDSDDYLPLPSKFDIHEYHIMEEFCLSIEDDEISEDLTDKIRGRGAFRRFKEAIRTYGIEEQWYGFRQQEFEKIAMDWLETNGIAYSHDKN